MLNKNQSHRKNSWKYAVIVPALIAFVILFQVKVIAQEKERQTSQKKEAYAELGAFTVDKNSTDSEMKESAEILKKQSGIEVKFSKIKRNSKGEIIAIKIDYLDKNGNKGNSYTNGDTPISPITIFKTKNSVGIRSDEPRNSMKTAITVTGEDENGPESDQDEVADVAIASQMDFSDMPVPPVPPVAPVAPAINVNVAAFPKMPTPPVAPKDSPLTNKKEWDKFEKKMAEFEKKMEAIQPQIDAYAEKMSNVDEQMIPFEKEMEAFEKKMEVFEKQMELYQQKVEAYQEKKQKNN